MLRGHRALRKSDSKGKLHEVLEALTELEPVRKTGYSRLFFGAATDDAALAVHQYLMLRIAGYKLVDALLYSLGKPG